MRPSGRLQLWIWRVRLQLRKSEVLRSLVRSLRRLTPDTRDRHMRNEVRFWKRWMVSKGLAWPEDYAARFDPDAPVQAHLATIIDGIDKDRIDLLDVGAGPVTVVGKRHPSRTLRITATDPLAREYNRLLDSFGLEPPVRTEFAEAERLTEHFGDGRFEIVHAQNSLDHSADPVAGIGQMLAVTRPDGFVVLLHEENEGRNELYHALHKWDFTTDGGHFVIDGPGPGGPRRDISLLLEGRAEVACSMHEGELLVVIRKLA